MKHISIQQAKIKTDSPRTIWRRVPSVWICLLRLLRFSNSPDGVDLLSWMALSVSNSMIAPKFVSHECVLTCFDWCICGIWDLQCSWKAHQKLYKSPVEMPRLYLQELFLVLCRHPFLVTHMSWRTQRAGDVIPPNILPNILPVRRHSGCWIMVHVWNLYNIHWNSTIWCFIECHHSN